MAAPLRLSLIVAMGENGVIGREGAMPWRLSSDLKRFRALTMGKPMIMGRKTYQSIGRPLEGRDSIVVTRQLDFEAPGAHLAHSLGEAIELAGRLAAGRGADEIMIIGGAEIYREALPLADRIYMTRVHGSPEGDTVFPAIDPARWREISSDHVPAGERDHFETTFIVLDRAAI